MFEPCIIIPVFRHAQQLSVFAKKLPKIPIIIIDDGNSFEDAKQINKIAQDIKANLLVLESNQGKNAAVMEGFEEALRSGYTHALQIDADGQHNYQDIEKFLNLAEKNPKAIINGSPIYDNSVPKSRLYGRKITTFWVAIETWSKEIKDAMCGFRVYPLNNMTKLLEDGIVFKRMGGDIEILVRACWEGIRIINVDTKVVYPEDGFSNFRTFKDNVKISALHTMLVSIMLKNKILGIFKNGIFN